jgi:hypothetical protein
MYFSYSQEMFYLMNYDCTYQFMHFMSYNMLYIIFIEIMKGYHCVFIYHEQVHSDFKYIEWKSYSIEILFIILSS